MIAGPKYQDQKLEKVLAENGITEIVPAIEPIKDPTLSQKLRAGEDISVLIVGDSIAKGEGASESSTKWFHRLTGSIEDLYGSKATIDTLTEENADVFKGWHTYSQAQEKSYDLILVVYGQEEVTEWDNPNEFAYFYEGLLRKIMMDNPKAEIMAVVENALDNKRANMIKQLADHYNLSYADTRLAFDQSSLELEDLTMDGILPNDAGYALYSDQIFRMIRTFTYGNKMNDHQVDAFLFEQAETLENVVVNSNIELINGEVSLNFSGSLLALSFQAGESFGIADVYLDGKYIQSIDTYSEQSGDEKTVLISASLAEGTHALTIQPSILTNENATGTELELLNMITN
jgi:hypothetical protein